jgi:hypothetical protein
VNRMSHHSSYDDCHQCNDSIRYGITSVVRLSLCGTFRVLCLRVELFFPQLPRLLPDSGKSCRALLLSQDPPG